MTWTVLSVTQQDVAAEADPNSDVLDQAEVVEHFVHLEDVITIDVGTNHLNSMSQYLKRLSE